jgi:hypothetical protein
MKKDTERAGAKNNGATGGGNLSRRLINSGRRRPLFMSGITGGKGGENHR